MTALPASFSEEGVLPPGEYSMTLDQLKTSMLVNGPTEDLPEGWEQAWRLELVENLKIMVEQLRQEGITEIFIDGSFATDKPKPGDIDGYFVVKKPDETPGWKFEEELCERLNRRDPHKVWTWKDADRKKPVPTSKGQLPMWWQYHVEFWPEYGQWSGQIHPVTQKQLTHAELFRITKTGIDKGIIRLLPSENMN